MQKNETKLDEIHNFYLPETNKWARTPMVTDTTVSNNTVRRAIIHGSKPLLRVPNTTVLWKRKLTSYSYMVSVTGFLVLFWIRSSCFGLHLPARRHLSSIFIKVILVWREVLKKSGSENPWCCSWFLFLEALALCGGQSWLLLAVWSKVAHMLEKGLFLLPPTLSPPLLSLSILLEFTKWFQIYYLIYLLSFKSLLWRISDTQKFRKKCVHWGGWEI